MPRRKAKKNVIAPFNWGEFYKQQDAKKHLSATIPAAESESKRPPQDDTNQTVPATKTPIEVIPIEGVPSELRAKNKKR